MPRPYRKGLLDPAEVRRRHNQLEDRRAAAAAAFRRERQDLQRLCPHTSECWAKRPGLRICSWCWQEFSGGRPYAPEERPCPVAPVAARRRLLTRRTA